MQLSAFFQGFAAGTCLEKRRECVIIREEARKKNLSEKGKCSKRGISAGVASSHGVKEDNVWLGNLIKQVVGVLHRGSRRVEGAEVDELGEDREVTVEVGFDGEGLELLELSKRGAFG